MLLYISLLDFINWVIFCWSMQTMKFLIMWFSPTCTSRIQVSTLCNPILPRMQPGHLIWRHPSPRWELGVWILCCHMWSPAILTVFWIWEYVEPIHMISQLAYLVCVCPQKIQKASILQYIRLVLSWCIQEWNAWHFWLRVTHKRTQNKFIHWLHPKGIVCGPEWQRYY
jgi:hypothetical protein